MMLALTMGLQWADAMTFAVVASVTPDLRAAGEISLVLPILGVGGTLLFKAATMLAIFYVARRKFAGYRFALVWAAALGALGLCTNSAYMLGFYS